MSKCKISYEEHNQGGVSIKIEGKTTDVTAGLLLVINQYAKERKISVRDALAILQNINRVYEETQVVPDELKLS